MLAQLRLQKVGTAQPASAPVSTTPSAYAWYDTESEPISFWEGGTKGKKFVNEKGELMSYLDTAANNADNVSAEFDANKKLLGVRTIGSGWTFNPDTSEKITKDTVITPETNARWLKESYLSFDNHLKSNYPDAYKDLSEEEKEGLYGYMHMLTGYMVPGRPAIPAKDGKPAVPAVPKTQNWLISRVTPKTHKLLSNWDVKNPERREKLYKELANMKANKTRVQSVIKYMQTGEVWDFSPTTRGGREYLLIPKKKR